MTNTIRHPVICLALLVCSGSVPGCIGLNRPPGDSGGGSFQSDAPDPCEDLMSATEYDTSGSGTKADPYLICTAEQLLDIGNTTAAWDRHFQLGEDLDLSGYDAASTPPIVPIGTDAQPFTGSFDGRNHTISNFTYHNSSAGFAYAGDFRCDRGSSHRGEECHPD